MPPGRAPRKGTLVPTDPPLPAPLATSITTKVDDLARDQRIVQGDLQKAGSKSTPPSLAIANARLWATKPGDSPKLRETIRDLQRFLVALPFPIIKITPIVVARIVCRALATQGVMPTNVVSGHQSLFCV